MDHASTKQLAAVPVTSRLRPGLFGGRPIGGCVAQQRPPCDGCRPWPGQHDERAVGWCRLTEPSPLAARQAPPVGRGKSVLDPRVEPSPRDTPPVQQRRRNGGVALPVGTDVMAVIQPLPTDTSRYRAPARCDGTSPNGCRVSRALRRLAPNKLPTTPGGSRGW
jgi:hypothetical protein